MQFFLLGKFSFLDDSGSERLLALRHSPRLQELLAYLLVNAHRPVPQAALARDLWGSNPGRSAGIVLHSALNRLQTALSESASLLRDDSGSVRWDPQAEVWMDVRQFEAAARQAASSHNRSLDQQEVNRLQAALDLYRGPFLEGCYSPWCLEIRRRLEQDCLQLIETLMDAGEARGDYNAGLLLGLRALCLERGREGVHRRLMRALYLSGDRTAALRQYQRCVEALAEDLQVQPGKETEDLHRQIRDGMLLQPAGEVHTTPAFPVVLANIHALQQSLSQLIENI